MSIPLFLFPILLFLLICILASLLFKHSTYHKITRNSLFQTLHDTGRYGEYLTYRSLKAYEADGGKFLFNCYLPKTDGKTTEIDVLLIHSTGIFVIESKNYSGWIFGKDTDQNWTQTLPNGRRNAKKQHFYNPVRQNATHIKWLREFVGEHVPVYSVIAFSKRCTLKKVTVNAPNVAVINRPHISKTVKHMGNHSIQALSKMDIARVYEILYPYTQVTTSVKAQHINDVSKIQRESKETRFVPTQQKAENGSSSEITITSVTQNVSLPTAQQTAPATIPPTPPAIQQVAPDISKVSETDITPVNTNRLCPRCGAALTLRIAKKGKHVGEQFYGCSRFPKCRYNENIKTETH